MIGLRRFAGLVVVMAAAFPLSGQGVATVDAGLVEAQAWVGRALILRGGYAGGELRFDAAEQVKGSPRVVDWTLAGMDLTRVSRRATGELALEGVRVVIGYNQGGHVFERHPQKDEKLLVVLAGPADAKGADAEMAAVFSQGEDPAFERAAPTWWSHYFLPGREWTGADELKGVAILGLDGRVPADLVPPVVEKKGEPEATREAQAAKVRGAVQLTVVVDTEGMPRRITLRQPLGYGLDSRAAEEVGKWRFRPGMLGGKAVAVMMVVSVGFDLSH